MVVVEAGDGSLFLLHDKHKINAKKINVKNLFIRDLFFGDAKTRTIPKGLKLLI